MDALDALNQVAAFHRTFHHPILAEPAIPAPDRCRLRVALLQEELNELQKAINDGDLIEVADALCDLQYVLSGAVLEFGMGEKFSTLFSEVQRSNMSKMCATREEAEATLHYYKTERATEGYIHETEGGFLVFRQDDHKTLKSINYSPALLGPILAQ
jgi:predicted HAD superfamily Cof-like phosphohydrolase